MAGITLTTATVTVVGQLVAELLAAGVAFSQIQAAAQATGKVPEGTWDNINQGIADEVDGWNSTD